MENLENNNEDDANVHDDVVMNNETGNGNANEDEDEDNNTGGQVVEEYVSTLADFPRIRNHYARVVAEEANALDNPAILFCLNIVSYSIQNIPDHALQDCSALTEARVLQGGRRRIILRTIGTDAFRGSGLRRINQFLKQGGVLRLEGGAFAENFLEGELIIPSSVLWVGAFCFGVSYSITSVVFEPSTTGTVVEIRTSAFSRCTKLSSATLPTTLERIPENCFAGCTALVHVPIPPTVMELGEESFAKCTSLPSMELPLTLERIPRSCFSECTALITAPIPPTVMELGEESFAKCTSLPSMELPLTLERIPRSCFSECTALITAPIPPTVVELGQHSFAECTSLPSMDLPESVDAIGREAFSNCTALTTVTIRTRSLNLRIGDNVFGGCTSLSTIRIRPYLWPNVFTAMNKDPAFLFHFFRKYHTTMFDTNK